MNNNILNDEWTLWSHSLTDNNWELNSYKMVYEFKTINDFWKLYNNFNLYGGLHSKHFYLMKKGIKPIWEDENNCDGCTCSIKIPIGKAFAFFQELSIFVIGRTLYDDVDYMNNINGLSISQKKSWSIIKIWNKTIDNNSLTFNKLLKNNYDKFNVKIKKNIEIA